MFVIAKPEVYKSPNSDTYIVFGEAKIEDMSQQAALQQQAAQQAQEQQAQQAAGQAQQESTEDSGKKPQPVEEEDEEVDETGVEAKDIDLVIEQTQCSRSKAVKALKANKGDIVNAIMGRSILIAQGQANMNRNHNVDSHYHKNCILSTIYSVFAL
jgi:nascent polypeptide-associated complex subunit alpha